MPLLRVQDLKIHFPVRGGWFGRATDVIKAVDKVSFDVEEGSTVGLVEKAAAASPPWHALCSSSRPSPAARVTIEISEILHHAGE
jgi:ABC-type microcin C transport system duplicated ATPase subunit YejF